MFQVNENIQNAFKTKRKAPGRKMSYRIKYDIHNSNINKQIQPFPVVLFTKRNWFIIRKMGWNFLLLTTASSHSILFDVNSRLLGMVEFYLNQFSISVVIWWDVVCQIKPQFESFREIFLLKNQNSIFQWRNLDLCEWKVKLSHMTLIFLSFKR